MNILEASQISISLQGKAILNNCTIKADAGEFIGIIGPNGSGKTTFLKTLRGLLPQTSGSVLVKGVNVNSFNDKELARQMAYMQQDINLGFGFSAKEIVMTGRYPYLQWWANESSEDEKIVEEVMRLTGVWELRDQMINVVSGGERQRIFLAKALAQKSDILLLDEPTAALDLVYADEIFRFCRRLCDEGKTILIVVHDLEMAAKFCTRLTMFSGGHIVGDGAPAEVLTAANLKNYFHLSSCVYPDPIFKQLRIFVYPNGETNPAQYEEKYQSLPEGASMAIVEK